MTEGAPARALPRLDWRHLAFAIGPGLVVMLADTEAGSVIAAAQAGAQWGYRLLLLQFALIPALFMAQELAARLGLSTRQGLAELALHRLGRPAALLLLATLVLSCMGALVTELSGLAGVGELYGVPAWQTASLAAAALFAVISTGSYRSVERVAIAVGLCELAFIALAWLARPELGQIRAQLLDMPFGDRDYLYLLAANLGTCVIPWAIFYQQSASIDKGLTRAHLAGARAETLAGAVLCQVITAAVLVAAASALHGAVGLHGAAGPHPLDRIGDIADAFTATIGPDAGRIVFAVGLSGGALVAGIIVCLTAGWALGEVLGRRPSIAASPAEAPWFYGALAVVLAFSVALVASGANLVRLSLAVGVLNALLLPIVLGFVFHFARRQLPEELRLRGGYALTVGCVFALTAGLGLVASVVGLL